MLYMHLFKESLQIKGNLTLRFFYKCVDTWKRLQVYLNIPTLYLAFLSAVLFVYVLNNDLSSYMKLNSNKIYV